jgi:hypothetical protein
MTRNEIMKMDDRELYIQLTLFLGTWRQFPHTLALKL